MLFRSLNPSEAFDELDKLIFCKIWDEKKDRKEGDPYDFQIITVDASEIKNFEKLGEDELIKSIQEEENKRLFNRVKELYEEGRKKDLSRPKNGLHLFCQFNLCFSFFKLSIVYKNSFTTSV